jgi:hypothetical protein
MNANPAKLISIDVPGLRVSHVLQSPHHPSLQSLCFEYFDHDLPTLISPSCALTDACADVDEHVPVLIDSSAYGLFVVHGSVSMGCQDKSMGCRMGAGTNVVGFVNRYL